MKYLSCTFNEKNFIYSSLRSRMNLELIDFLALDSTRESSMSGSKPRHFKRDHYWRGYRSSVLIITLESHPTPSKIAEFILILFISCRSESSYICLVV